MLNFSKYKYLHVKIASLPNVKSCVTVGPISLMANVWPCIASPSGLPLRLSSLTEDTRIITVSSCGVKLQEVLSGLERERLKHWRYTCTFVDFLNIHSFHSLVYFFSFHLGCNKSI